MRKYLFPLGTGRQGAGRQAGPCPPWPCLTPGQGEAGGQAGGPSAPAVHVTKYLFPPWVPSILPGRLTKRRTSTPFRVRAPLDPAGTPDRRLPSGPRRVWRQTDPLLGHQGGPLARQGAPSRTRGGGSRHPSGRAPRGGTVTSGRPWPWGAVQAQSRGSRLRNRNEHAIFCEGPTLAPRHAKARADIRVPSPGPDSGVTPRIIPGDGAGAAWRQGLLTGGQSWPTART